MAGAGDAVLAHGIGGAEDLPISPELAIAGAVAALTISFTVLALAWRSPRYDAARSGRPVPLSFQRVVDSRAFTVVARAFGMAWFLYAAVAAVLGPDLLTNPVLGMVYVILWVGIVPASLLCGPFWRAISPVRTLHAGLTRLTGGEAGRGVLTYPERLGYWPAALGLFAFVWLELVHPNQTEVGTVRLWFAVYVAVMLVGGALYGNRWFERGDPFEVYSTLVGKLSPWGRRDDRLVVRSPTANLDTVPAAPGLLAVGAVLFGSTAFDSFQASSPWIVFTQESGTSTVLLDNLALLGFCLLAGAIFASAAAATGVGPGQRRRALPDQFAHSLVPIIVGYMVAHYLVYFTQVGQQTLIQMSDPLSTGADLLGTADWSVSYWLSDHPTGVAIVKVLGVVVGHVVAVVAAHERAVRLLPRRHQITGQLPMLFAMVAFTAGGLFLLFAG